MCKGGRYSTAMHEIGIAASVLDVVRKEVAMRPGARAMVVGLRIGELAGVDPESLRFGFDALVKDSDLDPLELRVEYLVEREDLDVAFIELEEP